jgi:LmbE family N-acetylglucosaminyl deacetylase
MAVFAHPDDEVFGSGGTIALESERGTHVILVVATGGEAGEVVNRELHGTVNLADLPAIRQDELRCAAQTLGVGEVINLGYRDSGMAGTPENERADAFMNMDEDAVAGRLVEIIRRERPQVLVTFEPGGGYGHPDHLMAHRVTGLAFLRAGDGEWYPEAGTPWQPSRLFYVAIVRDQFIAIRNNLKERGIHMDTGFESISDEELTQMGISRSEVTTEVDIRSTLSRKLQAFRCYATQTPAGFFYLEVSPDILGEEFFILARSTSGPVPAHGLFEGLSGGE